MMEEKIKRVLVTGAGGTVGDYIVDELLAKEYEVIAVDLPGKHLKRRNHVENLTIVRGDLCDAEFVVECMTTYHPDALIHTAAAIDLAMSRDDLLKINTEMVKILYTAFRLNDGKIFVHFSSCSIYNKKAKIRTESVGFQATSAYEESKIEAEKFLVGQAKENLKGDPAIVILRPSLIYGPANKYLAANYLAIAVILGELFREGLPAFSGGPRTNLVHAEDVARAAVFLMEHQDTWVKGKANAFNIADNSPWGFGEQLAAIQAACGYKVLPAPLPLPPAKIIGLFRKVYESPMFLKALNRALAILWGAIIEGHNLKNKFTPAIDRGMTDYFGKDAIFSNVKIKMFGFKLKHPNFRKGILSVMKWYRDEKWVP
jgi:nucleoside-diphosphate-sugar epimerase